MSFILRSRCSSRSTSREVRGNPATIEYCGRRLLLRGRCSTWRNSVSFCVAGAALGDYGPRLLLRGRCSTWRTSVSFCVAGASLGAPPERSAEARRRLRLSTMDAGCFCVTGGALGAPQSHFAWLVQHLEDLSLLLCGRCSTWRNSVSFLRGRCSTWRLWTPAAFAWQVQHLEDLSLLLRSRCRTRSDAGRFCAAGPAVGASQCHFVKQVQHLSVILQGRCSTRSFSKEVRGNPATIEYYGHRLLLHGRRSTWRTSVSFCVAGAALGASQCHFAWQVQHFNHLSFMLRGRCTTWSTSDLFCVAGQCRASGLTMQVARGK